MFLSHSRNSHKWRNGTRRIAPDAVERGAFLPVQPFGPAPLHSTVGLGEYLHSLSSGDGRGKRKSGRTPSADPNRSGRR
jgi:hypothetical protein